MGNAELKKYENREKRPRYMVSDLLIQSRGHGHNYLAVEMKRKGNNRHVKEDKNRLASMVSSANHETENRCVHGTLVGAFIVYSQDGVKIQLFENKNRCGQKTDLLIISTDELLYGRSKQV